MAGDSVRVAAATKLPGANQWSAARRQRDDGVAGSEQRGYYLIMTNVVSRDREILGGTPVFAGTRVPVRNLIDCLEGGYTIDEFLEDFPTVNRDQVIAFLENTKAELELAVPA